MLLLLCAHAIGANTNVFFNASQTATLVTSNVNAVTINSGGYLFTYSVDGAWSSGGTTGRSFTVSWPTGVEAQAITAGASAGTGANITITRADGKLFDMQSFTGEILLNTAGAGGAFEIMPQINGNDAFANPLQYDCTGYAGQTFSYTTALSNYDTYQIHMWGDFALTALVLTDTNPIPAAGVTNVITTSVLPVGAGTAGGGGNYVSNSTCQVMVSANPGWGFKNWTVNGGQVSTSANYQFTVQSNRTLVANFVPAYNVTVAAYPTYGGSATGGGTFNSNSTVTVRATAASGYQFLNWTELGSPVSTSTNYTFAINADRALVANFAALPQTSLFDFDTGYPSLSAGQGVPASQSNNTLTATFTTVSGGWSFQTPQTSVIGAVPSFAGNFLYPSTWWSSFQIQFSAPVTNIAFDFMTGDLNGEYNTASTVRIRAYTNSATEPVIGTGTAQGQWLHGAYPDGHISFSSTTQFTTVVVDIAPIGVVSGLLFVDNVTAQRTSVPPNLPPVALGGTFYQLTNAPLAINIADMMVNDYDPDGPSVAFVGVSATTSNGLPLATNATQILVPANSTADSFTYTIRDYIGATASGVVNIGIITNAAGNPTSLDMKAVPGWAVVNFTGVPWYSYTIERATNALFTGTVQTWPAQAWSDGSISLWDDFIDLGAQPEQAFYRLHYP